MARVRLMGAAVADNAAMAFAAALAAGADVEAAAEGLSLVDRIERRLEPVGEQGGVVVVDDFGGKHPVNVREGLRAVRRRFPDASITAVFEPYGPYLARWSYRYARALGRADRVVVLPPVTLPHYPGGAEVGPGWWEACPRPVEYCACQAEAIATAMECSEPGDVVVFFAQVNVSRAMALRAAGREPAGAC
jgi:UDP-N-acetylmuramate-alanine ligase